MIVLEPTGNWKRGIEGLERSEGRPWREKNKGKKMKRNLQKLIVRLY